MADRLVRVDDQPDGVVTLRLDHPPMNTMSGALLDELAAAAAAVAGAT